MANQNFILQDEVTITRVLNTVQHLVVENKKQTSVIRLFAEQQDWAVVFAWLIDNHVISFKQRPPFHKFCNWVRQHPEWRCLPSNDKVIARAYEDWRTEPKHARIRTYLYDAISKLYSGQVQSFGPISNDFTTQSCPQNTPTLS